MTVPVKQFKQQILACGLLTDAELAALESQSGDAATTVEGFARELISAGRLTKFQAQALHNGKGGSLVLGNYFILDRIGAGGMGQVYLAEHKRMKRRVALKVLPADKMKDPDNVARFQRELQVAARLNHPNIVTAYDADESKGVHFYVMEHVDGVDLATLVRRDGPLAPERAIDCIVQAARGLRYAHEHGVIHRDIKPSNLLLDRQGTVKVLDMGLARLDESADAPAQGVLTQTGTIMGTVDYMSPEQALDTRHADARSDVYSLGCTLWFLLTGSPMFGGDTLMKRLVAHRESPVPSLIDVLKRRGLQAPEADSLLSALEPVFRRMVAKDPDERYRSMEEVVAALQVCLRNADPVGSSAGISDFLRSIGRPAGPGGVPPSGPTLAMPQDAVDPPTFPVETMPSGFLDHTLATGLPPVHKPRQRPKRRETKESVRGRRIIIGVAFGIAVLILVPIGIQVISPLRQLVLTGRLSNDDTGQTQSGGEANGETPPGFANGQQTEAGSANPETAVSTPAASGRAAGGLSFDGGIDGTGDYIEVPGLIFDDDSEPVTLEAWVRPRAPSDAANLFSWLGPRWIALYQSGDHWGVGKLTSQGTGVLRPAPESIQVGEWTHLAGVFKDDGAMLFINGRPISLSRAEYQLEPTSGGLFIGGAPIELLHHPLDQERWFRGEIRAVRVSQGEELPYRSGRFTPPETLTADLGTVLLYDFSRNTGQTSVDQSGNGHDGIIHGATWLPTE